MMDVLGFAEARASANQVLLPNRQTLHVVALPMLALLKVFAWADRGRREPRRDSTDLFAILAGYSDAGHDARIYDEAQHLLEDNEFDYRVAGAWLAGYDVRSLVDRYSYRAPRITSRLSGILAGECDVDGPLRLVGEAPIRDGAEYALRLLAAFLAGISGERIPRAPLPSVR